MLFLGLSSKAWCLIAAGAAAEALSENDLTKEAPNDERMMKIWCLIGIVVVVVIATIWFFGRAVGRKATKNFYDTLFSDLGDIAVQKVGLSPEEAESVLNALKTRQANSVFPPALLQIEYAIEQKSPSKVNRTLAVAYLNRDKQAMHAKIEREYDMDFIPDELSSEIIRAGKNPVCIELYKQSTDLSAKEE